MLSGNVYKIISTDQPNEFCFGCGNGMYFATFNNDQFALSDEKIFTGKYVTQIVLLPKGNFLCSIWNQSGVFVVDRVPKSRPVKIEDPRYNTHTTDLKPLFSSQFSELPFVVTRNKNSISLVDLRNRTIQPLIEIKNAELFCEKLQVRTDPSSGSVYLLYVTW